MAIREARYLLSTSNGCSAVSKIKYDAIVGCGLDDELSLLTYRVFECGRVLGSDSDAANETGEIKVH